MALQAFKVKSTLVETFRQLNNLFPVVICEC